MGAYNPQLDSGEGGAGIGGILALGFIEASADDVALYQFRSPGTLLDDESGNGHTLGPDLGTGEQWVEYGGKGALLLPPNVTLESAASTDFQVTDCTLVWGGFFGGADTASASAGGVIDNGTGLPAQFEPCSFYLSTVSPIGMRAQWRRSDTSQATFASDVQVRKPAMGGWGLWGYSRKILSGTTARQSLYWNGSLLKTEDTTTLGPNVGSSALAFHIGRTGNLSSMNGITTHFLLRNVETDADGHLAIAQQAAGAA